MKRMAEISGLDFLSNLLNLAVLCAGAIYVYAG